MTDLMYSHCLRTAFNPAHIQISQDGTYLALPITRTTVGVWSLQEITCKPLELEGHRKILTCMNLGNKSNPKLLCSAADDYVIVWNIQAARQMIEKGNKVRGQIIGTTLGCINYCCFSPDDKLVAACSGNNVFILLSGTEKLVATLEGHTGYVTAAEFCPHYLSTLVTISEDRTFKVWNINDLSLIYQSTIITASPFISIAMSLLKPHVAIGTADGQVRVYDLTDGNNFRCLHHIDVAKMERRQREKREQQSTSSAEGPVVISSKPSWQQAGQTTDYQQTTGDDDCTVEAGCAVLGIHYTYLPKTKQDNTTANLPLFLQNNNNHSVLRDLLDSAPMLVVGTTGSLLQLNAKTLDICSYVDLHDPITSANGLKTEEKQINMAGSVYFGQGADPYQIYCVIGSHFQNVIHLLHWKHGTVEDKTGMVKAISGVSLEETSLQDDDNNRPSSNTNGDEAVTSTDTDSDGLLTVLSGTPLLEGSPLRSELVKKVKEIPGMNKTKGYLTPTSKKQGKILDKQPLTFNDKVKSSGYTAAPRMTMFKPQTSTSKSATPNKTSSKSASDLKAYGKQYPVNCDPPTNMKVKLDVAERPTAINQIKFSDDGQYLACGLANKSGHVFKMPLNGKGSSLVGHNHSVTGVSWSHDSNWVITSSVDKTASVWGHGMADPLMTFGTVLNNFSADKESQKLDKNNGPFPKEVKFAQFYYMDKFILLTSGNTLYMYKYLLDPSKQDIKRYLSGSKYKLVTSFDVGAQQISALSAVNAFYSYLVFCSGTNKTLQIYDMNVSKCVRTMSDVHTKTVHVIRQNEGSTYVSHPQNSYDLFVTGAAGDCIKLWDLRSNRCVQRYEGHLNRVHPCGLDISPCGRFIATGSEDRSAYIFDVRTGTYCQKLTGHTDVISDVVFHPLYPQMVTATLDGKLKLYTDR